MFSAVSLSLAPFAIATIALAAGRQRGTTLVAPLLWSGFSLGLLAAVEVLRLWLSGEATGWKTDYRWLEGLQMIAATSTFTPLAALFGAKRPQSRAWQWIVLSLWVVAALPATENLLIQSGELQVHGVWSWFYVGLIVVGALNHLASRFAPSAILLAAGQICLLWRQLPLTQSTATRPIWAMGFAILCAAVLMALVCRGFGRSTAASWNRVWVDFRDYYGAAWALRVMERINALAQSLASSMRLDWSGFHTVGSQQNAATAPSDGKMSTLEPGIRNLLVRFVSNEWIDARLPAATDSANRSGPFVPGNSTS